MMFGYGRGFGYGHGFARGGMLCMMIITIIAIGVAVYFFLQYRKLKNGAQNSNVKASIEVNNNKAMDILNEKLALGEISEEEYANKKNLIKN